MDDKIMEIQKKIVFTISEKGDEGLQVDLTSFDNKDEEIDLDIIGASLIMLSLVKMLRDSGLKDDDLKDFLANVYRYALGVKDEEKKDPED
jgi:hypothetical protein